MAIIKWHLGFYKIVCKRIAGSIYTVHLESMSNGNSGKYMS